MGAAARCSSLATLIASPTQLKTKSKPFSQSCPLALALVLDVTTRTCAIIAIFPEGEKAANFLDGSFSLYTTEREPTLWWG